MTSVMIICVWQLDWAKGCPGSWYIALGVTVEVFPEEIISFQVGGLSKADDPPQCSRASYKV
jgi:hypothetical protein